MNKLSRVLFASMLAIAALAVTAVPETAHAQVFVRRAYVRPVVRTTVHRAYNPFTGRVTTHVQRRIVPRIVHRTYVYR